MIEYFPASASLLATQRADAALDEGGVEGCNALARISKAAQQLERYYRREGELLTDTGHIASDATRWAEAINELTASDYQCR